MSIHFLKLGELFKTHAFIQKERTPAWAIALALSVYSQGLSLRRTAKLLAVGFIDIVSIKWRAMDRNIKMRLGWVELFDQTKNAGLVCRRCGISRPTLRKWVRRHEAYGLEGLQDQSKRPHNSPHTKVNTQVESWILALRKRRLGARRIKNELYRHHNFSLSLATVHRSAIR